MPKTTILSQRAKEAGKSEEELLAEVFQQSEGSIDGAAVLLRAFPNTVRGELSKRGLIVKREVKVWLEKVSTP